MAGPSRRAATAVAMVCLAGLLWACGSGKPPEKQAPTPDSATLARKAESMAQAGRISDALASMDEAIANDPGDARLYFQRGTIRFRAGRMAEADPDFRRALEIDPYFTDSRNFLGVVCAELGRYAEAEENYKLALEDRAYPTPELVWYNLALLYRKQGRDTDAVSYLRRSVEINPKYYLGHFELASLLDELGNLAEAAREYEVAAPDYRTNGDYYYRLGFTYFRLGDRFRARDLLRRAIDVAPGSESAAQADELLKMIP